MDSLLSLLSRDMKGIPVEAVRENPQTILTVIEELAPIFKRLLKDSKISFEDRPGTPLDSPNKRKFCNKEKRQKDELLGVGPCPRGPTGPVGPIGKECRGYDGPIGESGIQGSPGPRCGPRGVTTRRSKYRSNNWCPCKDEGKQGPPCRIYYSCKPYRSFGDLVEYSEHIKNWCPCENPGPPCKSYYYCRLPTIIDDPIEKLLDKISEESVEEKTEESVEEPRPDRDTETEIEELQCILCCTNRKCILFNCGHFPYCDSCSNEIELIGSLCPICRANVMSTTMIYP